MRAFRPPAAAALCAVAMLTAAPPAAAAGDGAAFDIRLPQDDPTPDPAPRQVAAEPDGWQTRERKALLLNGGVAAAIAAYGAIQWDYFQTEMKFTPEGWFGRTTRSGGVDKLGHLWSTYAASHLLAYIYRDWGYSDSAANDLGALSGLGLQTLIEIGDSYSGRYGFSYEDMVMNIAGAGAAWALGRYPALKNRIDLRVEYRPDSFGDLAGDGFTDYEDQRYLLAVKLDGFDMFRDSHLEYLELHVGYFARGYDSFQPGEADERRRSLYVGVGLNVTRLIRRFVDTDFAAFNYIQLPYTSVRADRELD